MLYLIRQRAVSFQLNQYDGMRIIKLKTDSILLIGICLEHSHQFVTVPRNFEAVPSHGL